MQHLQLERTISRVEAAAGTVCGQQLSIIFVLLKWHRTLIQHRILTAEFSKPCRIASQRFGKFAPTLLSADDQRAAAGDALALAADHLPHQPPVVVQQRLPCVAAPGDRDVMPPVAAKGH